jgi:hypothetical protein
MLQIKWTGRVTNDEVFQKATEERLLLKMFKNRRNLWTGHIIRYNEFLVNILERAISGKKAMRRPRLQYLKQVARNTRAELYSNEKNGLQQIQMVTCQPIKRSKDKKMIYCAFVGLDNQLYKMQVHTYIFTMNMFLTSLNPPKTKNEAL